MVTCSRPVVHPIASILARHVGAQSSVLEHEDISSRTNEDSVEVTTSRASPRAAGSA